MMRFLIVCIWLIMLRATAVRGQYPPNFPKCGNTDEACILKATNDVIKTYYNGLPDANLLQFDPLRVKLIHLERNPSSPVNIDITFSDVELTGLQTLTMSSISGLSADLSGRTTFTGFIPEFTLKGKYIADGRVIILPVTGNGAASIACRNMHFRFSYALKPFERDGKTYAMLQHVKMDMDPEQVQFHFDTLYNGDKTLTDTMNEFINANWKEIYQELKPGISKATGLVLKSLINYFYQKQPYADFYL